MFDGNKTNEASMGKPEAPAPNGLKINSSIIDGVSVKLEAYLGEADLKVADLSDMNAGSIIELDRALDGPIELRLNGKCVGKGELVAVGDKFAVRITQLA